MERVSRFAKYAAVGAVSLVVGSVAVATGAIPGTDGTITGCYRGSGDLRVIDASESCRARETRLTWNQRGPRGDPGATGPAGPAGPRGEKGDPGVSTGPSAQYFHADLPVVEREFDAGTTPLEPTTPLAGGNIPGWGQLEGSCVLAHIRDSGDFYILTLAIRNESGGIMSASTLDNDPNDVQYGQQTSNDETSILARNTSMAVIPYTAGGGATVVRRTNRKIAAFRVVDRIGSETSPCEFDISMVLEP